MNPSTQVLRFSQFGPATEALQLEILPQSPIKAGEVRLKLLHAPINPADFNLIEGTYGVRPELPCVAGNEGTAEVIESQNPDFALGDRVLLPERSGTWSETLILPGESLDRIPTDLDSKIAAQLRINPATAWRMIHDFVTLEPGDWIIQNAATSAVGKSVIQIAKKFGFKTINLVRRHEDISPLKALGADVVLVDGPALRQELKAISTKPRLGLNAVGGDSATHLCKTLTPGGTLVTYGAMAKQPLSVPNGLLIFNDLHLAGFWITAWYQKNQKSARTKMLQSLAAMTQEGSLQLPVEKTYPFDQWKEALTHAAQPHRGGKILFQGPNA